jgi:hypothetical protein
VAPRADFYVILTQAMDDIIGSGFDSEHRLTYWAERLRSAARRMMLPEDKVSDLVRNSLGAIYSRLVERGRISRYHRGVPQFTIRNLSPRLRDELDRRILASANLINLNKTEAVEKVIRRFSGWATSIPTGGARDPRRAEVMEDIKKPVRSMTFIERRVAIDQGHKLTASINNIVAQEGGAIAVVWHSHWKQVGYDYRPDHKERDGHVYLLRDSWARQRGLVKPGAAGVYEDVTAVGEEVFCRCYATYLYHLSSLPEDMLTKKGADELARVRSAVA